MWPRGKTLLALALAALAGFVAGGYAFEQSQPRSLLGVGRCAQNCYRMSDIAGLAASVGIQRIPRGVPFVVDESDQCVAVRHPFSPHRLHFVMFPKRDIRNAGDIAPGDEPYVMGCFAMLGKLVAQYHMKSYRVYSNGPLEQDVSYLHFHLVAD
jgi:hypothetical protein